MNKDLFNLKDNWKSYYHKYIEYHTTCTSTHAYTSSTSNVITKFDVDIAAENFIKSIGNIEFVITARNMQISRGLPNFENNSILIYFSNFFKKMSNHEYEVLSKLEIPQKYKNFNSIFVENYKKNSIKIFAKNLNKKLEKKKAIQKPIKI